MKFSNCPRDHPYKIWARTQISAAGVERRYCRLCARARAQARRAIKAGSTVPIEKLIERELKAMAKTNYADRRFTAVLA